MSTRYVLKDVVFCDRVTKSLSSDVICQRIWSDALRKFPVNDCTDLRSSDQLTGKGYIACPVTSGKRYLLVLTKLSSVDTCIFMDGHFAIICHFQFDPALFDYGGTIFSGEIQRLSEKKWVYLINDIRQETDSIELRTRLSNIYNILCNQYTPDTLMDVCQFQVMKHVQLHDVDHLTDIFIPSLPYEVHSIRLRPVRATNGRIEDLMLSVNRSVVKTNPVKPLARTKVLRNKSQSRIFHNTLVNATNNSESISRLLYVEVTDQPDVYNLYDSKTSQNSIGIAGVRTMEKSKQLRQLFLVGSKRCLMKCAYDASMSKWEPQEKAQ